MVYRATDMHLGRTVALKVPRPDRVQTVALWDRFAREARLAATLDHDAIVPVLDAGVLDGVFVLVGAYQEGEPLSRWQATRHPAGMPPRLAAGVALRSPAASATLMNGACSIATSSPRTCSWSRRRASPKGGAPDHRLRPGHLPRRGRVGHLDGVLAGLAPVHGTGAGAPRPWPRGRPIRPVLRRRGPLRDAHRPADLPRLVPGQPERPPGTRRAADPARDFVRTCPRNLETIALKCLSAIPRSVIRRPQPCTRTCRGSSTAVPSWPGRSPPGHAWDTGPGGGRARRR